MKDSEAVDTVPSVVSPLDTPIVTVALGWESNTTVKVAVPPASVVTSGIAEGVTVTPTGSLSVLVAETSVGLVPV